MKYEKVLCPICNNLIGKNNIKQHMRTCDGSYKPKEEKENVYHLDHDDLFCKFCGKECKNKNSLVQHEIRCKENPDRKDFNHLGEHSTLFRKGKNKENCEEIAKQASVLRKKYESGEIESTFKGNTIWVGRHHKEETKKKIGESVSKSRKEGYANGTIVPAKGVGKGKYSYIIYKDKKYMLRSTYEFIYALYLLDKEIEFELESIRVPAVTENQYANTFISDFNIGNKIIEIKGIPSGKDKYIKEAFIQAGYEFEELFKDDIEKIKKELIESGYNVDDLISKIVEGHNSKNYFIYHFEKVKI